LIEKYDLEKNDATRRVAGLLPILRILTKLTQAQAGYAATSRTSAEPHLFEYALALSELVASRVEAVDLGVGPGRRRLAPHRALYSWCVLPSTQINLGLFDSYALRAALCAIRFYRRHTSPLRLVPRDERHLIVQIAAESYMKPLAEVLAHISLISTIEITTRNDRVHFRAR
jgi:hypothetical protein